jgi:hypothetical protein
MEKIIEMLGVENEDDAINAIQELIARSQYVFALFPDKKVHVNNEITLGQMLALFEVSDGMRRDIGEVKLLSKGQA